MQRLKMALSCTLLAAATGLAVQAILLLRAATVAARGVPVAISSELQKTRVGLLNQVAAARRDVLTRTERQVAALRVDVMAQVAQIRATADRRVGDSLERVDTALGEIEQIRGSLQPILVHTASVTKQVDDAAPLFLDCEYNPDCVFNRYVGASKGIERAALNFGQMSSDVRSALPGALSTWNEIAANVQATTEASTEASRNTAQVMANFARATKPLPTWARLGLAVAPPLAQVGASVATTLAVTGQLSK
jgi:ABC-type transporter Mla subunit MlaD